MSLTEGTLAKEWLNTATAVSRRDIFSIPRLVDFEDRLTADDGHYVLLEEIRRGRFRASRTNCRPKGAPGNYFAPLPGFINSPHDFLLQEEFSTLLKHPCGAELTVHYCRNGRPIKTLAYTVLPLLDNGFKAKYLVLQANEVRIPRRRQRFANKQKPDRLVGGDACRLNPNGFEYEIREYLDIGWGIPEICCDATPCTRNCGD